METPVSLRQITGKVCFLEHFRSVQLLCRDVSFKLLVSATFWVNFFKTGHGTSGYRDGGGQPLPKEV